MPNKSPTLYSVKKTTFWFAISSIILFISLAAMILQDSHRDWKKYQRRFMALSQEMAQGELERLQQGVDEKKLGELEVQLNAARESIKQNKKEYEAAQKKYDHISVEKIKVDTDYQNAKQYYDSYKYFYEEAVHKKEAREKETYEAKLGDAEAKLKKIALDREDVTADYDATKAKLKEFTEEKTQIEKEIEGMLVEQERLKKKIQKLKPSLAKMILNAPMLDFLKPTLQIQQVVLEDLYDDFYFTK